MESLVAPKNKFLRLSDSISPLDFYNPRSWLPPAIALTKHIQCEAFTTKHEEDYEPRNA